MTSSLRTRSHRQSARIDLVAEFPQPLQFVDHRPAAYPQRLGGFGAIEIMFAQHLNDGLAFNHLQALGFGGLDRFGFSGHLAHP